ncbi:MAG: gephyrin-like molybdotransferase Glp [Pseudomonadota bacterium]
MVQLSDDCLDGPDGLMRLDKALEIIESRLGPVVRSQMIPLDKACGRVLATSLHAGLPVPGFTNSAVDGYVCDARDLGAERAVSLRLGGMIFPGAGHSAAIGPGQAARIVTGAPLPEGMGGAHPDTVFMEEDCRPYKDRHGDDWIELPPGLKAGSNVRLAGEDLARGDLFARAGIFLNPWHLALAASQGLNRVPVYKRLKVTIISTGDELIRPSQPLGFGQCYDTNYTQLAALVRKAGCIVHDGGVICDDPAQLQAALQGPGDLIVVSAGMSGGMHDFMSKALRAMGDWYVWRLAIKPGRPVGFGVIEDASHRRRVVLGIPGNPAAAAVCLLVLGLPILRKLAGALAHRPRPVPAILNFTYRKKPGRREFVRVCIKAAAPSCDSMILLEKAGVSGAGILSSMALADGLAVLDEDITVAKAGTEVSFLSFAEFFAK